jgi:hypothetical protein
MVWSDDTGLLQEWIDSIAQTPDGLDFFNERPPRRSNTVVAPSVEIKDHPIAGTHPYSILCAKITAGQKRATAPEQSLLRDPCGMMCYPPPMPFEKTLPGRIKLRLNTLLRRSIASATARNS